MSKFNATSRVALEHAGNDEARAVLAELQKIEAAKLSADERGRAIAALKFGLKRWREDRRAYHEGELDKLRARYERDEERRAPAENMRLTRLHARVDAMTDGEIQARARAMLDLDRMDGDEVDAVSGRLRRAGDEPLRRELRQVAEERRAWSPWSWDGAGAEHADAVADLAGRDFHAVAIDYDGERLSAPLDTLLDAEGQLDKVTPA